MRARADAKILAAPGSALAASRAHIWKIARAAFRAL
jgi:hypothetical protein